MLLLLKHTLLALFAAVLCLPFAAFARPIDATVMIVVVRSTPATFAGFKLPHEGVGMGTAVDGGIVLTAAHVVFGASQIQLTDAEGRVSSARIIALDPALDVAVLSLSRSLPGRSLIRERATARGEETVVVPRWDPSAEEEPAMLRAPIQTTLWSNGSIAVPLILTGIKGETGMSGGGLFDARGRIVGIVVRITSQLGYLSVVPIAAVCASVKKCPPAEE